MSKNVFLEANRCLGSKPSHNRFGPCGLLNPNYVGPLAKLPESNKS